MKYITFLLFFCFATTLVRSQQSFDSGYIINLSQDTISGFFQASMNADLSSSVQFKKERNGELRKYAPSELKGFVRDKYIYRSMIFQNSSGENYFMDTAFVKQLVSGEYNLYSYLKGDQSYYLLQKDTTLYFLYNRVTTNIGDLIKEGNYQNYLSFISSGCKQLKYQYERVEYNEQRMAEFVFNVNKCISGNSVSYYQKPKASMQPVVFAGALPLGEQSQYTADFALRFTFPKVDKKTSFNLGVHFSQTTKQVYYYWGLFNAKQSALQTDQIISIPITIQYNLTTGRIQPYLYGGVSGALLKETSNSAMVTTSPTGQTFGVALVAGLGVDVRIVKGLFFKADWRYELLLQFPAIGLSYRF